MSRHRMPRARTSTVAPFIPSEGAQDRHWRRLEVALEMVDTARARLGFVGAVRRGRPRS